MSLGMLTLHIHISGCTSLKEKRSRLKPLLARLHREFNVSAAEMDLHDAWQEAVIACALVSNDHKHTQRTLQKIIHWIENNRQDIILVEERLEIL